MAPPPRQRPARAPGPTLSVGDDAGAPGTLPEVAAGDTVVVLGSAFVDGCDDTGGQGGGCSAPTVTERPLTDVTLTLRRAAPC